MDNRRQPRRDSLPPASKVMWQIFLVVCLLLLVQTLPFKPTQHQLSYSAFKAALRQGAIREVHISKDLIRGTRLVTRQDERPDTTGDAGTPRTVRFTTVRVPDPDLARELEAHNVKYTGTYDGAIGKTVLAWLLPIILMLVVWSILARRMGPGQGLMNFGKSRARIYAEQETGVTFADVAGIDEAKEELLEIIDFLRFPKKYVALGGRIPKGVLLVGPPGTGKTLLARAVAGEASVPFFSLSGSDFVEMFVGVGAARVRDLFKQAQDKAPAIVFIDELDAVGKARGLSPFQQNDEREQTLNQLLAEMDGFDPRKGVIILAATNRPEILDQALLRAGRFDRLVVVDRPDLHERLDILRLHAKSVRLAADIDLSEIAARTPGMVGSDLANVINEAALLAARYGKTEVTMDELGEAIERMLSGPQKKSRVMDPEEKKRVAYHESGHAIVAEMLPTADPVRKVSIVPRGVTTLGSTLQIPTEDRHVYTQEELLDRIAVLLGGRAAEILTFADVSTGAQDDLQKASDLGRRMVTAFGMSEQLGPYAVEQSPHSPYLQQTSPASQPYSEKTAHAIDHEAQAIVERMACRAHQILETHGQALEALAQYLLVHEVIDRSTLTRLLATTQTTPQRGSAISQQR